MPDLLTVFSRRWKLIATITVLATIIALIFALLSPKKYLAVATALPVNSVTADKARMFNRNIEALYSDFGTPDELDRFEGTAKLDTIFIAASKEFNLANHYSIVSNEGLYKAAVKLKRNSKIDRSGYGELKVRVWDEDRNLAAALANFLIQQLQAIHQHLQNEANLIALEKIKEEYALKQKEYLQLADSFNKKADTISIKKEIIKTKLSALEDQLKEFEKMVGQYQLTINTNSPVLLIVENARPPLWPDKPDILATVLFSFFGALLFSFLLVLFIESRKSLA